MENHVGAVWYFIHDYNAQQSKGLSRHHYYRITTFVLTQKVESIPLSEIQSLIDQDTAILEWYIAGDSIMALIVTNEGLIPPNPRVDSFKLSTANFESINLTEDSQVYLFLTKRVSHNN
jgi:hypothetical protein